MPTSVASGTRRIPIILPLLDPATGYHQVSKLSNCLDIVVVIGDSAQ